MSDALIRLQFMKIVQDMKICKGPDSMKACDGAPLESFLIAAAGISLRNGGHISSLALCRSTVTFTQALINAVLFSYHGTFSTQNLPTFNQILLEKMILLTARMEEPAPESTMV